MGKENTSTTDLICNNSNDANSKTTIEENKENSLKDKNSILTNDKTTTITSTSSSTTKNNKSSKLNSKKSEVLEDENSNDSSTSSDTKASSSTSTHNSSSTSTASKETSTSKSKNSSVTTTTSSSSLTLDHSSNNIKDKESENKPQEEGEEGEEGEVEKEEPQFRVASNNSTDTGLKLRIVPLEKLLEKPVTNETEKVDTKENKSRSSSPLLVEQKKDKKPQRPEKSTAQSSRRVKPVRRLPERQRKPTSFVEISETEEEEEDSEDNKSSKVISEEDDEEPIRRVIRNKTTIAINKIDRSSSPPSPSTVRRCVVKLKRSKLSDFKNLKSNSSNSINKKAKMNGGSEKPSTSRRKRIASSDEDDSDFEIKRADSEERISAAEEDDSQRDSSDSEVIPTRKRRVFQKDKNSNNSDEDFEPNSSKSKKKRRRIRKNSSDDSDDEDGKKDKDKHKRKDIRKIIKTSELNISTKTATKEEEERRKRIEERQKLYNQIYEKPDSVEVTELVLDFDPDTKKTLLEVDKGLMKKLKPHQVGGVKFMWDACFETIKDAQEKPGSGCILAHCMGLGKTMQIVTLSHTLLANSNKTNVERVLVISPLSTLNNWAREFKHWIGFTRKRNIEIYDMSKYKDKNTRIFKLNEWFEEGGVCIMGYDMYRILTNEKAKGLRKKQREQLQQSLVEPGPDLVVCDEGHLLKNEKTSISKAVTRMRTMRRIVLTGTPLQNNLKEYYCMIQFIKPNLLGTYKEYLNRFVNPIMNGQYTDSTERDIRLMKHRSHILHQLLQGCIQRRDYSVLAPYLPPKHEYVVYTTLSTLQQLLYEHYMTHQRDVGSSISEGKGARLFQDFQELRRIWTHPMNMRINSDSVIRKKVLANENDSMDDFIDDDNDEEEAGGGSTSDSSVDSSKSFGSGGGGAAGTSKARKTRNYRRNAAAQGIDNDSDIEEITPVQQDDPSEWWKRFVADKELNNINHSPKLVILMRLLEQCEQIGDKLLVFSQSLQSLDTIEHFLSLIDSKTRGYEYEGDVGEFSGFWSPGIDYFRLDGSCSVEQRESMCKKFNDSTNLRARLFLISTRAGGLGINLVSANRVVIFDVSWNPSHDTQSIFRVYRFGQTKPCYIYRLIAMGTMEQKLYERQVAKQATAKRVIDEQQISRHYNQSDLQELYTYELQPSVPREIPLLPKDRLFAELLSEHEKLLFKYHEHDSLLENEESENLSESERKEAWSEFEAEKTRTVQTAQFMSYDRTAYGGQYGNASGSVTSNKIFGFRSDVLLQLLNMKIAKDHPEMTQNQVIQVVPSYLNELYSQMNSGDPTMYKDLLSLHATLTHPSGMYMNPLLYVNQNPQAAGYYQSNSQTPNGVVGGGGGAGVGAAGAQFVPNPAAQVAAAGVGAAPKPAPGFDPNEVYEID